MLRAHCGLWINCNCKMTHSHRERETQRALNATTQHTSKTEQNEKKNIGSTHAHTTTIYNNNSEKKTTNKLTITRNDNFPADKFMSLLVIR